MPDPKAEQLRAAFKTVLGTVRTLANDGSTKSLNIEDIKTHGNSGIDLETVVEQGPDRYIRGSAYDAACMQDNYEQEYLVWVSIQEPEDSPAFDKRVNYVVADIRKTVMSASNSGIIKNLGFVVWVEPRGTNFEGYVFFTNRNADVCGVIIPFLARITTALNDPYN